MTIALIMIGWLLAFGVGVLFGWFGVRRLNVVLLGFIVGSVALFAKLVGLKVLLALGVAVVIVASAWLGAKVTKRTKPLPHLTVAMVASAVVALAADLATLVVYVDSPF